MISFKNIKQLVVAEKLITFDPFIHGTTSHILALLPKTRKIMGPLRMIKEFGLAPLAGEFVKGGLDQIWQESNTRFGRLCASGINDYTLEEIIVNYANPKEIGRPDLWSAYDRTRRSGFSTIAVLIIALINTKQLGIPVDEDIRLDELESELNGFIQMHYLLLFLGKYVHPNFKDFDQLNESDRQDICDAIYTHFKDKELLKRIQQAKLNLQSIYESGNPIDEQIEAVIALLELPKTSKR